MLIIVNGIEMASESNHVDALRSAIIKFGIHVEQAGRNPPKKTS